MAADSTWRYYAYDPSHALAYVAISLFAVTWICQCAWMYRRRTWYMMPFLIACLGEAVGYGFRRVSADHPTGRGAGLTWYILQELFIILCPALMIITYVGDKWTPVSSKWVTAIFVTQDVVSFVVQGAGGSLYSSDNTDLYSTAKAVLVVGFCIQIIGLGIFSIFAGIYHTRARRAGVPSGPWTKCLFTLYAGAVFVLIRGIFRTVEFGTGRGGGQGYLLSREGYYYGLEGLPIFLACAIFCVSYPGNYIPHQRTARMFATSEEAAVEAEAGGGLDGVPSTGSSSAEKLGVEEERKGRWWSRR